MVTTIFKAKWKANVYKTSSKYLFMKKKHNKKYNMPSFRFLYIVTFDFLRFLNTRRKSKRLQPRPAMKQLWNKCYKR